MKILRGYWEVISPFKGAAALAILLLSISGLLEGVALLALIPVLQGGAAGMELGAVAKLLGALEIGACALLTQAILAFGLLGALSALARFGAESILLRLRVQVERHLRVSMNRALLKMSWVHYVGLRLGDISSAALTEASQSAFGAHVFLSAIGTALVILALGSAAVALSPQLTAYTVLFGLLGFLLFRTTSHMVKRQAEAVASLSSVIGDATVTVYSNLKYVRGTGLVGSLLGSLEERSRQFARAAFASAFYGHLMRLSLEIGAVIMVVAFILLTARSGGGSTAKSLIFIFIFYRLAPRILTLQDNLHHCRVIFPWYASWKQRLDIALASLEDRLGGRQIRMKEGVRLEGITYSYPGAQEPVLQNVSLSLRRGECVALVGPSGSGKSTLMDLVIGLLQPELGEVRVDGIPLENLDLEAWRRSLGLVLQETPIFHASVLENIAWGAEEVDVGRVEEAARMAFAWEFIMQMPEGMDTVVGEKGSRLSGGQRQRLALARALYRNPDVLLLDEATSALDGQGEGEILSALARIKGRCTILMITHRTQTVQFADRILVLGDGRVVEEGCWEDLVSRPEGRFRSMVTDPLAPR